jgi:hypothetical protein
MMVSGFLLFSLLSPHTFCFFSQVLRHNGRFATVLLKTSYKITKQKTEEEAIE